MQNRPPANGGAHHVICALFTAVIVLTAGCTGDMSNQPRYEPLEQSEFFSDGMSSRPLPAGVEAWGGEMADDLLASGRQPDGELAQELPFPVTQEMLEQGRQQYDIYCSPCHGLDGYGEGMIVRRGFSPPPSFHIDRLRQAPLGHFVEVIGNGFGQMYDYASRVRAADRWGVAVYIRALQLSQNASAEHLSPDDLQELEAGQ